MYDVIIIGAGPAGLTSALYALRANKKVLILEAKSYGGQIINASRIENYPGIEEITGFDFATTLYNQVKKLGAEIRYEKVIHIGEDKRVMTKERGYQTHAIIIATGVENRKLNIAHEEEFVGKGVSYCATCDGNFYKNKVVAVNGGGNTALEDAIYLSDIAKKIYVIHRRDEFRGDVRYVEELSKKSNVEFLLNATVTSLNGINKLESITVTGKDNQVRDIPVDGLFVAIGQEPNNEVFANIVDLDSYGYMVPIDGVHTKVEGIYVAGDARTKELRQLTTAVSDGSIAATTALKECF